MDILDDLAGRGLLHDTTDREALRARLAAGQVGLYIGFDPTADSLHVGHLVGQLVLRRFQLAGHRPVALAGGATGMIGDPGGRSEERNLLDIDTLRHNVERIKVQLTRLLDFEAGACQATLVNNAEWTSPVSMLEFLRDVGKHFTVNQMLARDSVRSRLDSEHGISYTEFSYMLLQANDFRHLYQHHGVELQGGGSDQWGNMVAGVDLIRRRLAGSAHVVTHPLMLRADGTKFGKSASGESVWLDPARTTPYQFRQFWMQVEDAMVGTYLRMLSLRPLAEVEGVVAEHAAQPERRRAQRELAEELTEMVHGVDASRAAAQAADVLFGSDPRQASTAAIDIVLAEVPALDLGATVDGVRVHELLVGAGLAASNGEVNRLLAARGVRAGGRVLDADGLLRAADLIHGDVLLLRKGKRDYAAGRLTR